MSKEKQEAAIVAKRALDALTRAVSRTPYAAEIRNMALRIEALAATDFASEPSRAVAGLSRRTYPLKRR